MKTKLFLGKKAGLYFVMFQILMVVAAGAFITYYLNAEMEDTISARLWASRDLAIKISSIYSVPANYDEIHMLPVASSLFAESGMHSFDFDFQNNFVDISGKRFPYASDRYFSINKA